MFLRLCSELTSIYTHILMTELNINYEEEKDRTPREEGTNNGSRF